MPAADALNLVNEPVDTLASTNSITEKIVVDGNGTAGPVTITPAIVGGSAEVVAPNLAEADNGGSVIHEINKVIATWSYMSIAQVACDPSLDATVGTLCAAVGASSAVADALSNSGSYTVFAPTNGAFAALDQTFLQSVLADDATVTALLQKHALGSVVPASVALTLENSAQTTLNGEDITVDGSTGSVLVSPTVVGGASTVVTADVQACNGVVHVVDEVLALAALVPPPSPPPPPPASPPLPSPLPVEAPASSFPASSFSLSVGGDARRQRALDSLDIDAVEEAVRSSFANIFGGSAPPSTWRMRLEDRGGREVRVAVLQAGGRKG